MLRPNKADALISRLSFIPPFSIFYNELESLCMREREEIVEGQNSTPYIPFSSISRTVHSGLWFGNVTSFGIDIGLGIARGTSVYGSDSQPLLQATPIMHL